MRKKPSTWIFVAVTCAFVALPGLAAAQPSSDDRAAAEALFEEARALMKDGKAAEACPKFAESHRLDPGVGVLLYLGDCYEKSGQLASAWAAYKEAIPAARAQNQADRLKTATDRAAALESRIPRIVVTVPPDGRPEGLVIRRGQSVLGQALWGTAVPIDPGQYVVSASAPGYEPWSTTIDVKEAGMTAVNVPVLKRSAANPGPSTGPSSLPGGPVTGPPQTTTDEGFSWTGQHTAAVITGGVGIAGFVIGGVFGANAVSNWDEAEKHCSTGEPPLKCDPKGIELADSATTASTVSTVGFVIGGAGIGTAIILLATADWNGSPRQAGLRLDVFGAGGDAGLSISGSF